MLLSGMWSRVDLARTDVSEERVASIFRAEKKKQARKVLDVYYQTVNTHHSDRHENLKSDVPFSHPGPLLIVLMFPFTGGYTKWQGTQDNTCFEPTYEYTVAQWY
jgi:hypothetical protein